MDRSRGNLSARSAKTGPSLWAWLLVLAAVLLIAAIRIRLLQVPLERDEGEFAYMGQLMLQGHPPYSLAYNMKLPGIYAAYAGIMALFGQTAAGIHLGLLIASILTVVLMFLLGRRLYGPAGGAVAAAIYAVSSVQPGVLGLNAHATHFVVLFAVAGMLALLKSLEDRSPRVLVLAGLLMGVSVLMKQPGLIFVLFGLVYLLWFLRSVDKLDWKRAVTRLAPYLIAAALPYALICLWLWSAGVFPRFWFWTFHYALNYGFPASSALHVLLLNTAPFHGGSEAMWIAGAFGLGAVFAVRSRQAAVFVVLLTICSVVATSAGFSYRKHYFILMLPAVSLLVAAVTVGLRRMLERRRAGAWTPLLPACLLLVVVGLPFVQQHDLFFRMSPVQVSRTIYEGNPFPEAVEIGNYIHRRTKPQDTIAVIGSEPEILFESRRHSATGYIYVYSLMEEQPWAHQMQQEMIDQTEKARPRYLIGVRMASSWLQTSRSDTHLLRWAKKYMKDHYTAVGYFDFLDDPGYPKGSPWGQDAIARRNRPGVGLSILRRKD